MQTSLDTVDVIERPGDTGEFRRVTRYGVGLIVASLVIAPVATVELGVGHAGAGTSDRCRPGPA